SGGRRRPPAARHEGRGNADTIPWLRFVSASVIIAAGAKRCLCEACFVRMVGSDREWRGQEKKAPLPVGLGPWFRLRTENLGLPVGLGPWFRLRTENLGLPVGLGPWF
ncbi:hypothetical protein THAOC_21416, partial [Thalassiosira oceanica]